MTHQWVKRPFLVKIPGLLDLDQSLNPDTVYEMHKAWIEEMHQEIAAKQPKQKTPEEIAAEKEKIRLEKYEAHLEKIRGYILEHTEKMLRTLVADPYLTKTQVKARVGCTPDQFTGSIEYLSNFGLIETTEFALKTKKAEFFPLTDKAHDLLESTPEERKHCPKKERFPHRLVNHKIFMHLVSFGLSPISEFTIKGIKKWIDNAVNTRKDGKDHWLAIEAMITDLYYLDKTLDKCLNAMQMDELIIVTRNAEDRKKAKATLKDTAALTEGQKDKVRCMSVKEFLTSFDPTA